MQDGNAKVNVSERRAAARKRAERDRMREAGFVLYQGWVHQEDRDRVKRLVSKLRRQRGLGGEE